MKKLFIVLAVASLGFVACNNESETATENKDTTTVVAPDPAPAAPAQDTTAQGDTTAKSDTTK